MEVPGLVGPKNEENPVVEEGSKSTNRKRRLTDLAKDIYKRGRAHIEKRGLARGRVESDDEIIDVMGGFDRYPPSENSDPVVESILPTNGLDAHRPRRNFFDFLAQSSTHRRL